MVRKKRKGLVKESLSHSEQGAQPAAVDVRHVVEEIPLNVTLPFAADKDAKSLGNDILKLDLATWFEQLGGASSLYEQLRLLQSYRANVKKLRGTEEGVSAFTEASWRLMFRLYGSRAYGMQGLHKNFALILQDLVLLNQENPETLTKIAKEELRRVLDTLFNEESDKTARDPDATMKVLSHLQMMLEFPYVLRVLVEDSSSYLLRTVQFIADELAFLVGPIVEYQKANNSTVEITEDDVDDTTSGPTNAVLMASERCSYALKCVIVLCSLKDALYDQLFATSTTAEAFNAVTSGFMGLLSNCALILKTRVVHKDLLTQTGLAYCLVLRLLIHGDVLTTSGFVTSVDSVKGLFHAFYPGDAQGTATVNASLGAHLTNDMPQFGEFARLAVFRGFLNSLSDDELVLPLTTVRQKNSVDRTILDFVFSTVHEACHDESLNTRLYAFQVLEAFLRRAVGAMNKQSKESVVVPISSATVANLTTVVLLNWENPSKRVNQFMHVMFTHIVNYQVLLGVFDEWKQSIVVKLTQLPQHSRARYGGLSIVIARYGATTLLNENPGLLQSVLHAVGIKDVSAAAAGLFTQILDELDGGKQIATGEAEIVNKWRAYWMGDVVAVMLSHNAKLRASVAMYALPLLLKKDPGCVPLMIQQLRDTKDADKGVMLWAIIEVLKFARKKIAPEKLLGLSMAEIQSGLENARPEARGAAFEALCGSLKSTNLPTRDEILMLQRYLVISSKEITASTRMNSLNSLKTVFFRVKEFLRISAKENARESAEQKDFRLVEIARAQAFQEWIELFIVTTVYPGSLVQRTIIGLEVLYLYLQVFGIPEESRASLLMTPHTVTCLLNMLIGSWDVIRSLANSILDLYPPILPGYTTHEELEMLWRWAMTLCISPRQRESDAGAHFMQLLYHRSDSLIGQNVLAISPEFAGVVKNAQVRFVLKLTETIIGRLATANIQRGESPLVHGLLLSLRYIVDGTAFTSLSEDLQNEWRVALAQVFICVQRSMQLSLAVVGDATSGVGDEKLSDTFEGVVGEVSAAGAKTSTIPLRVDCRGHLILEDAAENEDGEGDTEQRAVVGSWLAARECGAIIDTLMRRVPLPTEDSGGNLFSADLARQSGEMLLNSLFELKHKGAVATAYESFEGICKSFLAHGEKNAMIGSLPSSWADKLLDRLEKSEQQFILRRSSGFAYSFVAILRAEPRNTAAIILPRVMTNLLRLAAQDTDAMAAAAAHQQHHLVWRSRVHALNILKLISQDAVLSDDVAVYVSQMLEIAIFGFDCRSWVVRNSSMMLFAAATQRALGDKRIADGASKNKIPSAEVFSRFPQLDGFLYRALQRFTAQLGQDGGVTPPGLFPVLMFLSRLRPTDEDEDEALRARGSRPLADFVPVVRQCASQTVVAIRQMAAQVLGTIVRVEQIVELLKLLSEELPKGFSDKGAASSPRKRITTNQVHGLLLQAQALISKCIAAEGTTRDNSVHGALAFIIEEFLPKIEWLATDRIKCESVRAVVLEIIESIVNYQATRAEDVLKWTAFTERVANESFVQVDRLSAPESAVLNRSPGLYKANRASVGIFFGLLRLQWKGHNNATFATSWLPRVAALIQSPVLEVRKRASKQLGLFAHLSSFDFAEEIAVTASIQKVLLQQLSVETHPTVKTRLLHLLIECQDALGRVESEGATAVSTIQELLSHSADVDVLSPSLRLFASFVRDGVAGDDVLVGLKNSIVERSSEFQPLGLRFAAAIAIERSDILSVKPSNAANTVEIAVDLWMTAIKLLQDDDNTVRDVIRRAVHRALRANDASFSLDDLVSETSLLPVAVRFVVTTFGSSSYGFQSVRSLLLSVIDAPTLLVEYTTGAKAQDWGDLCHRIFEAEASNFYAEPDLIAQLIVVFLFETKIADDRLLKLKEEILEKLVKTLQLLNEHRTREQWLGGMTYYSSVFPTLFSLLCAGVAVVKSSRDTQELASLLTSTKAQAIEALPSLQAGHPLVLAAVNALSQDNSTSLRDLVHLTPTWKALQ
ncbi:hypothetical protein Poli38472_011553 [Pythium oligandrum]|uniref:DUF2428 domain-containing protein n=1 Tax=Pythium oligandrum TaxID=41045 RepID=A0A8K1CLS2_PYTOL|nr:hypothetical protein Poli38472_011553 [Pythium oligandrum]|eukprot:TMW64673.1 hypothetical protein Poli38472_011553 [Pythium oligandrum]